MKRREICMSGLTLMSGRVGWSEGKLDESIKRGVGWMSGRGGIIRRI